MAVFGHYFAAALLSFAARFGLYLCLWFRAPADAGFRPIFLAGFITLLAARLDTLLGALFGALFGAILNAWRLATPTRIKSFCAWEDVEWLALHL
jgi:hypothetical protein